jgi:hypothetical protein
MSYVRVATLIGLIFPLIACESLRIEDDGIPRINSQRDIDEYNATVSSEGEKLVCTRERPLGSNIRQYFCMTQNQRDRLVTETRDNLDDQF